MTLLMFDTDTPSADGILSGQILFGSLAERFGATSAPWSARDYEAHWKDALQRAADGSDVALVTDWNPTADPTGHSGQAWFLYWIGPDAIAVQQRLLVNALAFSAPDAPAANAIVVGDRKTTTDDGNPISEWTASRTDVTNLLELLSSPS